MSAPLTTTIHHYRFDTSKADDRAAYEALRAQLTPGPSCMHAIGTYYHPDQDGLTLTLETTHLFANQWNTAPIPGVSDNGLRVFDWAEEAIFDDRGRENQTIKRGHWLTQTPEMIAIRRDTLKCGYCGKQAPASAGLVFCPHCIDSEYLKPGDLRLTRLVSVDRDWDHDARFELTDAERAEVMPRYIDAQVHGAGERRLAKAVRARERVHAQYAEQVTRGTEMARRAAVRRDGFLWLLDHGISTENVIYYDHTGRFGFGWQTPVSPEVLSALLDVISEFKWDYDIKTADGRTLSS